MALVWPTIEDEPVKGIIYGVSFNCLMDDIKALVREVYIVYLVMKNDVLSLFMRHEPG